MLDGLGLVFVAGVIMISNSNKNDLEFSVQNSLTILPPGGY